MPDLSFVDELVKSAGVVDDAVKRIDKRFPKPGVVMDRIDPGEGPPKGLNSKDVLKEFLSRVELGGEEVEPNFHEHAHSKKAAFTGQNVGNILRLLTVSKALGLKPELIKEVASKMKRGQLPDNEQQRQLGLVARDLKRSPQQMAKVTSMMENQAQRDLELFQKPHQEAVSRTSERIPEHSFLSQQLKEGSSEEDFKNAVLGAADGKKTASFELGELFNDRPGRVKRSEDVFSLLSGRYPVSTYSGVEKAATYFQEHGHMMPPAERREFCANLKVAARAMCAEHVLDNDKVAAYTGFGGGPFLNMAIEQRKLHTPQELHSHLDYLKTASLTAADKAEVLAEIDKAAGLDVYWGGVVPDPWASVFHMDKTAEFRWESPDGELIDDQKINELCTNHLTSLKSQFDHEFVREFQKDPITVFKSLPEPTKVLIARLAADMRAPA